MTYYNSMQDAQTARRANDIDTAITAYQQAITDRNEPYYAFLELGMLHREQNYLEKALAAYDLAEPLAPAHQHSHRLYRAGVLLRMNDRRANKDLQDLYAIFTEHPFNATVDQHAVVPNDLQLLESDLKLSEDKPEKYLVLSAVYWSQNAFKLAVNASEHAYHLLPENDGIIEWYTLQSMWCFGDVSHDGIKILTEGFTYCDEFYDNETGITRLLFYDAKRNVIDRVLFEADERETILNQLADDGWIRIHAYGAPEGGATYYSRLIQHEA